MLNKTDAVKIVMENRAYFEPRAQMGNLTGAQQKSLVTLVTDQQNWTNQIAKKKTSKIQILS